MTPDQNEGGAVPGPWFSVPIPGTGRWAVIGGTGVAQREVCSTPRHPIHSDAGNPEADARLIAAAPELLEELEGFVADLTSGGANRENQLSIDHDRLRARIARALAAIAKARATVK